MPDMLAICHWLETTSIGVSIARSPWIFPAIESIHMFGIVAVVGATSILDLRLMGIALNQDSVSSVVRGCVRWVWGGFIVMVVTGTLMFVSEASRCYINPAFRIKVLLLALAGLNALAFHTTIYHGVAKWELDGTPASAKFIGAFSLVCWFGVIAMGRWIAFS